MKIKHTLTLFCVTLTLVFLLASCADTQGNGDGGDNLTPAKVSAENCAVVEPELNCFISVWKTDHDPTDTTVTGYSGTMSVKLPLVNNGEYNFYVDWGDGKEVEKITSSADATHTYTTPGEYTIHIAGTIKGWRFFVSAFDQEAGTDNDYGDAAKLLNVTQWGSLSLGNTDGGQFRGAENFNPTATDAPDVSETTSLVSAFNGASNFNGEIGNWDVSQITDMFSMFVNASAFNQDISGWNVRQVTSMSTMFSDATSFNNGDEKLDWGPKTSKVTFMDGMFNGASNFNVDISNWDVSQVISMGSMFGGASVFNQDICYWNVENVSPFGSRGFANASALENKNNPFDAECTARKSN